MITTNMSIRIDPQLKEAAEMLFEDLGLTMTSAINIFIRQSLVENGLPFEVKRPVPNETTVAAILEGRQLAVNNTVKGYTNIEDLRTALE